MCYGAEAVWGTALAEEAAAAAAAEFAAQAAATAAAEAAAAEAAGAAGAAAAGGAAGAAGAGAAGELGAGAGLLGAGLGTGAEEFALQASMMGGEGLLPAEAFGAGDAAGAAGVAPQDMALADPESAGWYMRTGGELGPKTGTNMAWDKWANTMAQMNNLNRPQQGVAARAGGIYPQKQQGSFQSVGAFGGLLAPANTRRKK